MLLVECVRCFRLKKLHDMVNNACIYWWNRTFTATYVWKMLYTVRVNVSALFLFPHVGKKSWLP